MTSTGKTEFRAFSSHCKIVNSVGKCCANCLYLQAIDAKKKKRKHTSVHPKTNKHSFTKDEVVTQLQEQQQQRIKAQKTSIRGTRHDEDDHNDLVTILLSQTSENILEEMKCMWEQQITLIQQNKHGYCWHPK